MKTAIITIVILVILALIGFGVAKKGASPTASSTPTATQQESAANLPAIGTPATADNIVVEAPKSGDTISSPVAVSGKARGNWFFEASAPVAVVDLNGTILGRGIIQAQGEWMTTDFVPFTGSISFSASSTTSTGGALLFMNDNPSGQASTSKYFAVPVYFKTP